MRSIRKSALSLLLVILFTVSFAVPVLAAGTYVYDQTGYMVTESEWNELNSKASLITDTYNYGLYVVILDDYTEWGMNDFEAVGEYIFTSMDFGTDVDKNGMMLILSMDDRDYRLIVHGTKSDYAITDYGMNKIEDAFLPYLKNNDWVGGFNAYLDKGSELLQLAEEGRPLTVNSNPVYVILSIVISLVLGFIGALAVGLILRSSLMHSVHTGTEAHDYIKSSKITNRSDVFTHVTTVRTRVESSSKGSGGGGGGFRSHGGKF